MTSQPLLTIAIPTWNRARFLEQNLRQLKSELHYVDASTIEVLVSDNCSPDETAEVVAAARTDGMDIRYVRNASNVGWGRNFAQCFELARGRYVLLLGDDDLFVDGALGRVVEHLSSAEYGVVLLRPYGFDYDFRREFPGSGGRERVFEDPSSFLVAVGPLMTLISACVFNKTLISDVDAREFESSDLGALPLVLRAALAARQNLYVEHYLIASKRQNSFSYDFAEVFVNQFWRILDDHLERGLRAEALARIERHMLISYYPFYLFDIRKARRADARTTLSHFERRFGSQLLYRVWLAPILWLPRPFALCWGAFTTVVGRVAAGEFKRGLAHALASLSRRSAAVATSFFFTIP